VEVMAQMFETLKRRSQELVSIAPFSHPVKLPHLEVGELMLDVEILRNVNVLRMPLDVVDGLPVLPKMLAALQPMLELATATQKRHFDTHPFWYVTVRSGWSDERAERWHTDGFSMRIAHKPEQNYIWTSEYPTEVCQKAIHFPWNLDGKRYNIHLFIAEKIDATDVVVTMKKRTVYVIDPYVIHRKPKIKEMEAARADGRVFVRISNVPIEIEDDNYTTNPEIQRKFFGRHGATICDGLEEFRQD
jgi:hypothetical protein